MQTLNPEKPSVPAKVRIVLTEPVPESSAPMPDRWWERVAWFGTLVLTWCLQNPAWFISGALHLGLVVVLADLVLKEQREEQPLGIVASLAEHQDAESFEIIASKPASSESGEPEEKRMSISEQLPDFSPRDMLSGVAVAAAPGTAGTGGSGGGDGAGSGDGQGEIAVGIAFFGTQAEGDSLVYVVDMSQSMQGPRFRRAISELIKSIAKLKSHQKFLVIFFNDQAYPMFFPRPEKGMVAATSSMKGKASRWIRSRIPVSFTNAIPALEIALELKPDSIIFLTDGELPDADDVVSMLRSRNKDHIVIHTIAFENPSGEATLQSIARENGGTYRFVK